MTEPTTTAAPRRPINVVALRTICGAIYFQLTRYPLVEIPLYNWHSITDYLRIPEDTVYWLEIRKNDMILSTREFVFWYQHNADHSKRLVEITYRQP